MNEELGTFFVMDHIGSFTKMIKSQEIADIMPLIQMNRFVKHPDISATTVWLYLNEYTISTFNRKKL